METYPTIAAALKAVEGRPVTVAVRSQPSQSPAPTPAKRKAWLVTASRKTPSPIAD